MDCGFLEARGVFSVVMIVIVIRAQKFIEIVLFRFIAAAMIKKLGDIFARGQMDDGR